MTIEIPRAEKAPQEGFLHEGERRGRGKGVAARVGAAEIAAMGKGSAQEGRPPSHRNGFSSRSGVPHGLFSVKSTSCSSLQNAHASGSLRSPCGCLRTVTSLRNVPVLRMAYFTISHHRPCGRWCSARLIRQVETLELQPLRGLHQATPWLDLQNAHAPGSLRSPYAFAP